MLARSRRVSKKLFGEVLSKGRSYHTLHFSLKAHSLKTSAKPRFSFVVPKKVEKTAVKRNKIRRRGMAVVRKNFKIASESGSAGIFFAKSGSYGLSHEEYEKEITSLLSKIGHMSSSKS